MDLDNSCAAASSEQALEPEETSAPAAAGSSPSSSTPSEPAASLAPSDVPSPTPEAEAAIQEPLANDVPPAAPLESGENDDDDDDTESFISAPSLEASPAPSSDEEDADDEEEEEEATIDEDKPLSTLSSPSKYSYPQPRLQSGFSRSSVRKSGFKVRGSGKYLSQAFGCAANLDILSLLIISDLWHVVDLVFSYMDAVTLRTCEEVCRLWSGHIRTRKTWRKVVMRLCSQTPDLMHLNGWDRLLPLPRQSYLQNAKDDRSLSLYRNVREFN